MNATPINVNPAQAAPTQPSAGRQQDSAAPEMSFSQALSREIEQSRKDDGRPDSDAPAPRGARPAASGPKAAAHARPDGRSGVEPPELPAADAEASPDILLAIPLADTRTVPQAPRTTPVADDAMTSPDAALATPLSATGASSDSLPAMPAAVTAAAPEAATAIPVAEAKAAPEALLALPINPAPLPSAAVPAAGMAAEHAADPAPGTLPFQGARNGRAPLAAQADRAADPARIAAQDESALAGKATLPAAAAFPAQLAAAARQSDAVKTTDLLPDLLGNPALRPAAQAALESLQAPGDTAASKLSPAVGTPAWNQALGEKIVWMATAAQQTATLTLNPPNMGPLQIVLDVSDAQATASFFSAQPEVRQALEASLPRLREMMNDAGIQLGQASVSADTPRQNETPGDRGHRAAPAFAGRDDAVASGQQAVRMPASRAGRGLVDTFA